MRRIEPQPSPRRPAGEFPLSAPAAAASRPWDWSTDDGFLVATGLECSAPTIEGGVPRGELRLSGHWDRYAEDFALAADLGAACVRWGVPFHVVAAHGRDLDWARKDVALRADDLPARGHCWYSLTDRVDRDSGLVERRGRVNDPGPGDVERHERPVARLFRTTAKAVAAGRYDTIATGHAAA